MGDRVALQPIIKRSHSPSQQAISNEALRSPTFIQEPPSPNLADAAHAVASAGVHAPQAPKPTLAQGSYFALQPSGASTPSLPTTTGILLNRLDRDHGGHPSPGPPEAPPVAGSAALLRVASPDGSASESGTSEAGNPAPSTAPTSAAGSPIPAHSVGPSAAAQQKPNLSSLYIGGDVNAEPHPHSPSTTTTPVDPSQPGSVRRASSPPSPHCHFAPLPRVDTERPESRRNSTANRVKPFVPKGPPKAPERADSILAAGSAVPTPHAHSPGAARALQTVHSCVGGCPTVSFCVLTPSSWWRRRRPRRGRITFPTSPVASRRLVDPVRFGSLAASLFFPHLCRCPVAVAEPFLDRRDRNCFAELAADVPSLFIVSQVAIAFAALL